MKKVKVIVFALLLISFLNISCGPFGGYGGYSNKKRSSCLFYDGKIIGFDFSKVQNQEMGRSYIPLYIKLNKKYREDNKDDYESFISMVIEHFESWAHVKVTGWQMDNSQSLYDFLSDYEGRINGLWVKYESREQLE